MSKLHIEQLVQNQVSLSERQQKNGHLNGVIWLTGLSGSGKSTLAVELEKKLFDRGRQVYVLDGDNLREGLNSDLTFSPGDREENIRRVGEVAALYARAGFIVISAFISPYQKDRRKARHAAGNEGFHEVWVKADLATCEKRDPKGLYRKARAGVIKEFTGISAPYEEPEYPDLVVDTHENNVEDSVALILSYVDQHFLLK